MHVCRRADGRAMRRVRAGIPAGISVSKAAAPAAKITYTRSSTSDQQSASSKKPPGTSVLAAFFRRCQCNALARPRALSAVGHVQVRRRCVGMRRARGEAADARQAPPWGCGSGPDEAGADPARAVVTPPHLPAKMNGFYALMRQSLTADRHGSRSLRMVDFFVQFYAPWLCDVGTTISSRFCTARRQLTLVRQTVHHFEVLLGWSMATGCFYI